MCDIEQAKQIVESAIRQLYKSDQELLRNHAHEQSVTACLAGYLREEFTGWHVDCEYNRDAKSQTNVKQDRRGPIRPDIIVHVRGTERNLLAIEVKPFWSSQTRDRDVEKLEYLTGETHKYRLGALIALDIDNHSVTWFSNGAELNTDA